MKKYLSRFFVLALLLSCTLLAGCSSTIYGKTYEYKGKLNISYSSLDARYGKGIENIITAQIKENNIDWANCKIDETAFDVSDKNFTKGSQVIDHFTEIYKEKVDKIAEGIQIIVGTQEEMTLTAKKGDDVWVYNLKPQEGSEGFVCGYLVEDGVEADYPSLTINEKLSGKNIFISGANYKVTVTLPVKNALIDYSGNEVDCIEINICIYYTKA